MKHFSLILDANQLYDLNYASRLVLQLAIKVQQ